MIFNFLFCFYTVATKKITTTQVACIPIGQSCSQEREDSKIN